MKYLSLVLAVLYIAATGYLTTQIINDSLTNQRKKKDYAELNDVKYGLFAIDEWKKHITIILRSEIDQFNLTNANERELRKHVSAVLSKMIDKAAEKMKSENKKRSGGWFKQALADMFVDVNDVKKGIPEYTNAVIKEMNKPKTKDQLRTYLNERIKEYATETADTQDRSELLRIYNETDTKNIEDARTKIDKDLSVGKQRVVTDSLLLVVLSFALFGVVGFGILNKVPLTSYSFLLLLYPLILLLITGITTPMIDMEAKISKLSLILIGHPVVFENQVLYFQSKSILNVFWVMMTHPALEMKLVGILLVTFSVLFPLLKTAALLFHYYDLRGAKANRFVQFFVFKSGKWSMTDVMVVAIFMAYIGFNGIIDSQLGNLGALKPELDVVTTNGTALQPGYYLFLTYSLLALALSVMLAEKPAKEVVVAPAATSL